MNTNTATSTIVRCANCDEPLVLANGLGTARSSWVHADALVECPAPEGPCRETNGTFMCQRGVHVGSCESVHSVDVMRPGNVLVVRWGNGQGSKTVSRKIVL